MAFSFNCKLRQMYQRFRVNINETCELLFYWIRNRKYLSKKPSQAFVSVCFLIWNVACKLQCSLAYLPSLENQCECGASTAWSCGWIDLRAKDVADHVEYVAEGSPANVSVRCQRYSGSRGTCRTRTIRRWGTLYRYTYFILLHKSYHIHMLCNS